MRTYKGTIYEPDREEYNLPSKCEMVNNGYWVAGSRKVNSYVFANGKHQELQFSKDRHNVFYLETVN